MTEHFDNDSPKENKQKTTDSPTPVLDNFSRDLIKLAEQGKIDPVIGREKEIIRIAQILSRRKKNNPIILGGAGSGKTSIVEGLAMKIFEGDCPRNLLDKRILSLDMTSIVAGTKYRGQFEERMKVIIEELQVERRFQKVVIDGSSKSETLEILKQSKIKYEEYHKVNYSEEVLISCVELADRYITDREFPDKAFDIMDEVGARCQVEIKIPDIIEDLKTQASDVKKEKLEVVKRQNFEQAAELRDKEKKILAKLEDEKKKFEKELLLNRKDVPIDLVSYSWVVLVSVKPIWQNNWLKKSLVVKRL